MIGPLIDEVGHHGLGRRMAGRAALGSKHFTLFMPFDAGVIAHEGTHSSFAGKMLKEGIPHTLKWLKGRGFTPNEIDRIITSVIELQAHRGAVHELVMDYGVRGGDPRLVLQVSRANYYYNFLTQIGLEPTDLVMAPWLIKP